MEICDGDMPGKQQNHSAVYKIVLGLGLLMTTTFAQAQFGEKGFLFSLGAGTGYSSHADSYQVVEDFRVREYPGVRIFIVEAKLGWNFGEQTSVYATGNVSPGNTTITPYRSYSAGIGISQSFGITSSFYAKGGAAYYSAGIEKGQTVGTGILTNLGIGVAVGPRSYFEFNTHFGKLDEENYLDPNPFKSGEFQFNILFSFAIF
jgi:hypothetical protein